MEVLPGKERLVLDRPGECLPQTQHCCQGAWPKHWLAFQPGGTFEPSHRVPGPSHEHIRHIRKTTAFPKAHTLPVLKRPDFDGVHRYTGCVSFPCVSGERCRSRGCFARLAAALNTQPFADTQG